MHIAQNNFTHFPLPFFFMVEGIDACAKFFHIIYTYCQQNKSNQLMLFFKTELLEGIIYNGYARVREGRSTHGDDS